MNSPQLPSVELIQGNTASTDDPPPRGRRLRVFLLVLLISGALGVALVYSRSPVYRAAASVLTVEPKAVDMRSADADIEHVAIQGRLLLGEELLGRLAGRLGDENPEDSFGLDQLRAILSVTPVPDTNLLELRAEGEYPQQLQRLVNRWAESYEAFRAEEIEAATGRTTAEINDQQTELSRKIDNARAELQAFRETHDIVSLERNENRSLASLKGLNDSLNKAHERLVEAQARKLAIDDAVARGEAVIPDEQKSDITRLQLAVQRGRTHLAELRQKYTERYIERDPVLKSLPNEVRAMERDLVHALRLAGQTVSDEASQAVETARVAVASLEAELAEQQNRVQTFTEHFKTFQALEEGLARLDTLYAENEERLAQIQVRNLKKFPPIQIVEWARVPTRPIYPNYERDLMIALGSALVLALFVTWLVDYLSAKPASATGRPTIGVRIYGGDQAQALGDNADQERLINADPPARLAASPPHAEPAAELPVLPRELAVSEVQSLLSHCDPETLGYAVLMLSGVSPYELPLLHAQCFTDDNREITLSGANRRVIEIDNRHWPILEHIRKHMSERNMAMSVADFDQRLDAAANRARLADPSSIDALALWHTYVVYLIRQGIDTSALTKRVGSISGELFGALVHFAPPGGNRPLDRIELTYPALPG